MADLQHPSREQVVARAVEYFDKCCYSWGGFPGTNTKQYCIRLPSGGADTTGNPNCPPATQENIVSGPWIGSDCSGYTSWCWYMRSHVGTRYWIGTVGMNRYRVRTVIGNTFEESFPGIQPGDCLIREIGYRNPLTGNKYKTGHIVLYVGNNTILGCSQRDWSATSSKHGMHRQTGNKSVIAGYQGFTIWDNSEGVPYDPDEIDDPVGNWNQSDGQPGEPSTPEPILDEPAFFNLITRTQYTKKYTKMKHYRQF